MAAPDTQDGRVTMGVLSTKLDFLIEQRHNQIEHDEMIVKVLVEHSIALEALRGERTVDCTRLDGRIDRVEDKVKGWQVAQGGLTIIATTVAAWLGIKL